MARRCELTGKGVLSGNNVSHSQVKTRRKFLPNLHHASLHSETLNRNIRLRVSSRALRSIDHRGGFDQYLLKARDSELSANALRVKREIIEARKSADAMPAAAPPPTPSPAEEVQTEATSE